MEREVLTQEEIGYFLMKIAEVSIKNGETISEKELKKNIPLPDAEATENYFPY